MGASRPGLEWVLRSRKPVSNASAAACGWNPPQAAGRHSISICPKSLPNPRRNTKTPWQTSLLKSGRYTEFLYRVRLTILWFGVLGIGVAGLAQRPETVEKPTPTDAAPPPPSPEEKRTELNLLGQTNVQGGESRRNENIQFNLIDNNALKELNIRMGTVATSTTEFRPELRYFGTEFGNKPPALIHVDRVTNTR